MIKIKEPQNCGMLLLSQEGHFKKYCKKFKANQKEGKQPDNSTMAGVATENNNAKLLSVFMGNTISDSWILDSGLYIPYVCKQGLVQHL